MSRAAELNILWLWPDILGLHGDRGNVMAIFHVCSLYGIKTRITRVSRLTDNFDPEDADIILLGAGELSVMPEVAGAMSNRFSGFQAYAKSGGVLFCTGTTVSALGVQTTRLDGSYIYGIGLINAKCDERETVLGDDLIFNPGPGLDTGTDTPVYGIQIQMVDLRLGSGQTPLGELTYGYGNDGCGSEGAINDGVIFTNAQGPVLIKNPWLTLGLIKKAMLRKNTGKTQNDLCFDPSLFIIELESAKAIQSFNDKKEKPK